MSTKKQRERSVRAAREDKQARLVMKGLIAALILLMLLSIIAFAFLGNGY